MFVLPVVVVSCAVLGAARRTENVPRQMPLANLISSCTLPNTVALTFDDGPYLYANDISDALVAANATGTFFFNGNNWDCIYNPDEIKRVQYVYSHGHQVASHTWSHPDLTQLSWDQIHNEMWLIEQAIHRITGAYPAFFRPPYGKLNDLVRQAAYARGQQVVIWDLDSQDSVGASVAQQQQNYDTVISQHPSNILALNHEIYNTTAYQTLPYAIQKLKAAGYRLVTLAECVGQKPYQYVDPPQTYDAQYSPFGWTSTASSESSLGSCIPSNTDNHSIVYASNAIPNDI